MEEKFRGLCIYTKKNENEAKFRDREHIIPACIGGMKRLEQGYVSDEVNNQFSKLELLFGRESLISIPRMFVGPGKRGSKNPKKRGGAGKRIAVMESQESGRMSLGYIQMGKPIMIDQLHIEKLENGRRKMSMGYDNESSGSIEEKLSAWIGELNAYNGSPVIIKDKRILLNEMILGLEGKRWYLAISEEKNGDEAREEIRKELKLLKMYCKQESKSSSQEGNFGEEEIKALLKSGEIQTEKTQVTANMQMAFQMQEYFRVIAKIVFNCLADIRGRDYVLQEKFDPIRKAILTGENIEQFVQFGKHAKGFDSFMKRARKKNFGSWLHMIVITRSKYGLSAVICLYGTDSPMAVWLSDKDCKEFGETDGFVCDWENKREMSFLDFVGMLAEEFNML